MIRFEALSQAQARLGGTIRTVTGGVSSYSCSAAYTAFFLAFSSRFCVGDAKGKVSLVKTTHTIRANASWDGILLINESFNDILDISEVGDLWVLSWLIGFLVADKRIIKGHVKQVKRNFFVPKIGLSC